jgi:hypothetical protein
LHAHEKPALPSCSTLPITDQVVDRPPAAKIEVAHAKVGSMRQFERLPQLRQQKKFDIVEYPGHRMVLSRAAASSRYSQPLMQQFLIGAAGYRLKC